MSVTSEVRFFVTEETADGLEVCATGTVEDVDGLRQELQPGQVLWAAVPWELCDVCGGTGSLVADDQTHGVTIYEWCPNCGGTGRV
jgi:hypothetical protein